MRTIAGITPAALHAPADRTFATVSTPVHRLMSITVPFFGVLLVSDLHRAKAKFAPKVLAAMALAVVIAVFGALVCAVAIAVASSDAIQGGWRHVGVIALGASGSEA